tara:strand:- start:34055 stop:34642 length:588 start_codon:yes stop_codon:yes gene_type:complete
MTIGAERINARITREITARRLERDRYSGEGLVLNPLLLPVANHGLTIDYKQKACSLRDLLTQYDRQFVKNSYLVVLKRDADVQGMNDRLTQLRTGQVSRIELIFRLRYGAEGRSHAVRVKGLSRAFAADRLRRVPVVGGVFGFLRALYYLPRLQRDMEEMRGYIAMQKNDSDERDTTIVDHQNTEFARIARFLQK